MLFADGARGWLIRCERRPKGHRNPSDSKAATIRSSGLGTAGQVLSQSPYSSGPVAGFGVGCYQLASRAEETGQIATGNGEVAIVASACYLEINSTGLGPSFNLIKRLFSRNSFLI